MDRRSRTQPEVIGDSSYLLQPGYIYFSKEPTSVKAVLGSCVAVCLWDKVKKMGGMNHFQFPFTKERTRATARYGNVALATLLRLMDDAGCRRGDLEAQIFGGASRQGQRLRGRDIGIANVSMARKILSRRGISVVSEDVGGLKGRKVIFDTGSGESAIFKVQEIRDSDWLTA